MTHDEHLSISQSLPPLEKECESCHNLFSEGNLFRHEASGEMLCFDDLVKYLKSDIEDSEDHKAHFQGWEFFRSGFKGFYEASFEEVMTPPFRSMDEVLEMVLMNLKYI